MSPLQYHPHPDKSIRVHSLLSKGCLLFEASVPPGILPVYSSFAAGTSPAHPPTLQSFCDHIRLGFRQHFYTIDEPWHALPAIYSTAAGAAAAPAAPFRLTKLRSSMKRVTMSKYTCKIQSVSIPQRHSDITLQQPPVASFLCWQQKLSHENRTVSKHATPDTPGPPYKWNGKVPNIKALQHAGHTWTAA